MQIQLSGLPFEVHSPSQYELVHTEPCDDRVFVWYNGFKWALVYHHANGNQVRRIFNSRDAAMTFLACVALVQVMA